VTQAWLKHHGVRFHALAMRRHKDWQRSSVDVKLSAFEELTHVTNILRKPLGSLNEKVLWIDDDQKMLDALPSDVERMKV
jgi:hypothetical protein